MNIRFACTVTCVVFISACTTVPINTMNNEVKHMQQKVDSYSKQVSSVNDTLNDAMEDLGQ